VTKTAMDLKDIEVVVVLFNTIFLSGLVFVGNKKINNPFELHSKQTAFSFCLSTNFLSVSCYRKSVDVWVQLIRY
jgi:hypothetical protein